jgi:hypothetical protein
VAHSYWTVDGWAAVTRNFTSQILIMLQMMKDKNLAGQLSVQLWHIFLLLVWTDLVSCANHFSRTENQCPVVHGLLSLLVRATNHLELYLVLQAWRPIVSFFHLFTCAYNVWVSSPPTSHPLPLPHLHFQAETVLPLSLILLKREYKQ